MTMPSTIIWAGAQNWTDSTSIAEAAMARPNVEADLEAIGLVMPAISDAVATDANGVVTRTIEAYLSIPFMALYPTEATRRSVLTGVLPSILQKRVPCVITERGVQFSGGGT
jgi:hypothetical protein